MKLNHLSNPTRTVLLGSFISSIGSWCFLQALLKTFGQLSVALTLSTIFILASRTTTLCASAFLAPHLDRFSEKKVLLATEFFCLLCSLIIFLAWNLPDPNFGLLIAFAALRAGATTIHMGSRSKVLSILGGLNSKKLSNDVLWLNKLSLGTFFFSALIVAYVGPAWPLSVYILIDGATFLLNGILLLRLPDAPSAHKTVESQSIRIFKDFFYYCKSFAVLDVLSTTLIAGLMIFIVRLSQNHPENIPFMYLYYGATVWLSGFLTSRVSPAALSILSFLFIGIGFGSIPFADHFWQKNLFFGLLCLGYWNLYNLGSIGIQIRVPKKLNAGVSLARNLLLMSLALVGEYIMGFSKSFISLNTESCFRALLAFLFLMGILKYRTEFKKHLSHSEAQA